MMIEHIVHIPLKLKFEIKHRHNAKHHSGAYFLGIWVIKISVHIESVSYVLYLSRNAKGPLAKIEPYVR